MEAKQDMAGIIERRKYEHRASSHHRPHALRSEEVVEQIYTAWLMGEIGDVKDLIRTALRARAHKE